MLHTYILTLFSLIFDLPLFTTIAIFRYSRTGTLCNSLSEGLKTLAIRQLQSLLMPHGLVTGKLMSGTGLHLGTVYKVMFYSFSRSSVSELYMVYQKYHLEFII